MTNLERLLEAGVLKQEQVAKFTTQELGVIEGLSEENVEHLIRIRRETKAGTRSAPEILGHW